MSCKTKMLVPHNVGLLGLCLSVVFIIVKSDFQQSHDKEGRLLPFIQSVITRFAAGSWSKSPNSLPYRKMQNATDTSVMDKVSDSKRIQQEHESVSETWTSIESSMVPVDENLDVSSFLDFGRQVTEPCSCVIQDDNDSEILLKCSTVCSVSETICGHTCTRTTSFSSFSCAYPSVAGLPKTVQTVNEKECKRLSVQCLLSSALSTASKSLSAVATASVGANVALAAGIAVGVVAFALALTKPEGMQIATNATYHNDEMKDQYHIPSSHDYQRRSKASGLSGEMNEDNTTMDLIQTTQTNRPFWDPPTVEGSLVSAEENLDVTRFLRFGRQISRGCNCIFTPTTVQCSTTCLSYKQQQVCGVTQVCTLTTIFSSFEIPGGGGPPATLLIQSINDDDCDSLESACNVSSALLSVLSDVVSSANAIATNAIIAGVLSAGLSVGNIAAVANSNSNQQTGSTDNQQQSNNENQSNNNDVNNNQQQGGTANQVPVNNLPFPVTGADFPLDGCGDGGVRFSDGICHPVLKRGPCNSTHFWVTIDPITLQGKCSPRLCNDARRVFIGATGLCHDVNDPNQCRGDRRLYNTAYGDSICDCPVGQYPFPNSTQDDCVPLFSRGPCPDQQVMSISQGGRLFCGPAECQNGVNSSTTVSGRRQQLVPTEKGDCFALGSPGFCLNSTQLLGYNVFARQLQCVNITGTGVLPRESSLPEISFYINQQPKIHSNVNSHRQSLFTEERRRQDGNEGVFQFPGSSPADDSLLQPCRTGARLGINYKCANPLVPEPNVTGQWLPAISPDFRCPMEGTFLQAGGQCVNDNRATNCGPSFQFNEATGQCRMRF